VLRAFFLFAFASLSEDCCLIYFTAFSHGIQCTSIIAAEKGNGLCNAGIAFEGKVVRKLNIVWL
jgi:hypothetical protein